MSAYEVYVRREPMVTRDTLVDAIRAAGMRDAEIVDVRTSEIVLLTRRSVDGVIWTSGRTGEEIDVDDVTECARVVLGV